MLHRRILAALAALCFVLLPSHAWAQKTKAALTTEINTSMPTGCGACINALVVRSALLDIVNSYLDSNGGAATMTAALDAAFSCTNGQFAERGASVWGCVGAGTGLSFGGGNLNIANIIVAGGPTGSATVVPILTYNAQGQLTVVSSATITPAFSSITGTPTTLAGYGIASPLPLAQGGIGIGSGTSGGIPYFASTSTVASSAALGAGLVVVGGGAGVTPATIANGQLPATATNDNANAGNHGEFISSTVLVGSAVGLTTNTDANVTSISLTAGDWDVSVNAYFTGTGTTTVSFVAGSATTTSATRDTSPGRVCQLSYNTGTTTFTGGAVVSCVVGPTRFSLSGTTTVFFTGTCTFGASTCAAYGIIRARRMR